MDTDHLVQRMSFEPIIEIVSFTEGLLNAYLRGSIIQSDGDYNRFYAEAEVTLNVHIEYAEIQLSGFDSSVHAGPLRDAKVGTNTFYISGIGASPFKVGDTMRVYAVERLRVVNAQSFKVGPQ
jgi:hypothetical protein